MMSDDGNVNGDVIDSPLVNDAVVGVEYVPPVAEEAAPISEPKPAPKPTAKPAPEPAPEPPVETPEPK